jgi:hypothetical protein
VIRSRLHRLALVALVVGLLVVAQCTTQEQKPTGILLTLTVKNYLPPLTRVQVLARNIDYEKSELSQELSNRDLAAEPLEIFISESRLTQGPANGTPALFLVHARGFNGSQLVVADAKLFKMVKEQVLQGREYTLTMRPDFVDADGDGFEPCGEPGCDCNDQNSAINPLTREKCGDRLDNNCSGLPVDELCPCAPEDTPRACTTLPFLDQPELMPFVGVGACKFGTQACVGGVWQEECVGGGGPPQPEDTTNSIDDNCNGVVDEGGTCTTSTTRPCLLGRIPAGPDGYNLAGIFYGGPGSGIRCRTGTQTCDATGHWENACKGEVRPQRDPSWVGFVELPSGDASSEAAERDKPPGDDCEPNDCLFHPGLGQCDGVDNDCDGQFDEEPWFDSDKSAPTADFSDGRWVGDGYTYCGTNIRAGGSPTDPDDKEAGLSAEFIDCNDSDPNINPGMREICGATSDGVFVENEVDENCRCDHDPLHRPFSDPDSLIGKPDMSLADFSTGDPPRLLCANDAYLDCARSPRSYAVEPAPCSGVSPPYYFGYYPDAMCGSCYLCGEMFGQLCSPNDPERCTTYAEDCAVCDARGGPGVARPRCRKPHPALCTGQTSIGANDWLFVGNEDPCDDCPLQNCDGAPVVAGEPPIYWGLEPPAPATNARCYYAADVVGVCDGAGACMTRIAECSTSIRGREAPGRQSCHAPDAASCVKGRAQVVVAEVYAKLVGDSEDPYGDCPGTCHGNGTCHAQQGEGCGMGASCEPGSYCVDGVCCNSLCSGLCQSCLSANTGQANGICANIAVGRDPDNECAPCTACSGAGACANLVNNTQDTEGTNRCDGTCQKCLAGVCANQAADEDLFGQCYTTSPGSAGSCRSTYCSGTAAACGYLTDGEQSQPPCKRCDGTSYDPVDVDDDAQDTEGSSHCNGTCERCLAGSCVYQLSTQDLFSQCDTTGCLTGDCSGGNASCGHYTGGERNCPPCWTCSGATSGACVSMLDNTQDSQGGLTCNGTCQACQFGVCDVAAVGTDPGSLCAQGATAADGCRSDTCSGVSATCDYQSTGDGGCPICRRCDGATSQACTYYAINAQDTTAPAVCRDGSNNCGATNCACRTGSCLKKAGESCSSPGQCASNSCVSSICQ